MSSLKFILASCVLMLRSFFDKNYKKLKFFNVYCLIKEYWYTNSKCL